ncbi:MAG: glycosyltransferase family 1 protein [Anaerolineae bacterium]|nr:glycosyltransferase family 1 protein [Anaerolineae bacterium]
MVNIVIIAQGTRGDVQPIIALGKGLNRAGYTVRIVAGQNFKGWVEAHGLDFSGTIDMEAVMQSPTGVAWAEGSANPLKQLQTMKELLHDYGGDMLRGVHQGAQGADLLISGFVSEPFTQAISEKYHIPQIGALLQPYRPTRSGAASLSPIVKRGNSFLNRWMGLLGERLIWSIASETTNKLRVEQLGLPPHNTGSYTRAARRIPTMQGFSPSVVPHAPDWGSAVYTTGYWFLDEQQDWQPSEALARFLAHGAPPIYFGFGSMGSSSPQQFVDMVAQALRRTGQRGVISKGWSGAATVDLPDYLFMLDKALHDWLFPRMAAVVHHGGSGTTAAGLRVGVPTLIIPHMADQPFWGRRVYELGVGATPIPRHKLTVDNLTAALRMLVTDPNIRQAAKTLGERICLERGVENAVQTIRDLVSS